MSQSQKNKTEKRKADISMETDEPQSGGKSDVVCIDILTLNGRKFDHKFTGEEVKDLWNKTLKRPRDEVIGLSSARLENGALRLNIHLNRDIALEEVSATPDFEFERSSVFKNCTYSCRVVGFGSIVEADVGDVVNVVLKFSHFRFKPEAVLEWLNKYGKIIGNPRYLFPIFHDLIECGSASKILLIGSVGPGGFCLHSVNCVEHCVTNIKGSVELHTKGYHVTTYADDTYVVVTGDTLEELRFNTEECMKSHLAFLDSRGMVTNVDKTEAVIFGMDTPQNFRIGGTSFDTGRDMKVLGVTFDSKLSWTPQVDNVLKKAKKLNSALKFMRSRLTIKQFLRVVTSQFYSVCLYGCAAWLNDTTNFKDIRRLNSIHYRVLRIAVQDYRRIMPRRELDQLGRTRPTVWSKYQTASIAIKAITSGQPARLMQNMTRNSYVERRRRGRLKFYDGSRLRIGRQMIDNRLCFMNDLDYDWLTGTSDDRLRIELKKHFKMAVKSHN